MFRAILARHAFALRLDHRQTVGQATAFCAGAGDHASRGRFQARELIRNAHAFIRAFGSAQHRRV
jgi:hypothetical protein